MIHRFGDFELDEKRLELRRRDKLVPIQALPLKLITLLIGERARVVSKSELIERVWDGWNVSDNAVAQVVMLARRALGEPQQAFIATVRGRGFRFVAQLSSEDVSSHAAVSSLHSQQQGAAIPGMPPETLQLLQLAAVLGAELSVSLLASLMLESEASVLERLEPAFCLGAIRAADRAGQLAFVDEQLRASLYDALSPSRRALLHQQAGELLEKRAPDARTLDAMVDHLARSASPVLRQRAVAHLRRAAEGADAWLAPEASARLFDRALELSRVDALPAKQRHDLLMNAGHAWYRAGDVASAVERFEQALCAATWDADATGVVRAVLGAFTASRATLMLHSTQHRLCESLRGLPQDNELVSIVSQAAAALGRQNGPSHERIQDTMRALDRARHTGDSLCIEAVLRIGYLVLLDGAHPRELHELTDAMVNEGRAVANQELLLDGLLSRIVHSVELGHLPACIRDRTEYLAIQSSSHSPVHRYLNVVAEAADKAMAGSVEQAEALSKQAATLGAALDPQARLYDEMRRVLYLAHYGVGDEQLADRSLDTVPNDYRPFWSLLWARSERTEDARRVVRHYAQSGLPASAGGIPHRVQLAVVGEVCALLGERELCAEVYDRLLCYRELHLVVYSAGVYVGPMALQLALTAAVTHDDETVRNHFETALAQALAVGAFPAVVRVRRAYAQWLTTHGAVDKGATMLAAAEQLARGLGLPRSTASHRSAVATLRPRTLHSARMGLSES